MDITQDLQVVVFRLAAEEYALPITKVKDINRVLPITKIPQAPSFMEGIINLRGSINSVVDLRGRFGLKRGEKTDDTRIMIIEFRGQTIGIIVDAVEEVLTIPAGSIDLPPMAAKLDHTYIVGIGKVNERLLVLLDIDKVFNDDEIRILQNSTANG